MNAPNHDFAMIAARRRATVDALRKVLPAPCILFNEEDTRPYECDGLSAYRQLPMAVALPEDEVQVVAVLRTCRALGVPIVPRGAGTGLSGGAMPIADGIVLSMAKLNRIIAIDAHARTATVQPGVRNLAISEAAAGHALYYAPDPSSQIACTIGGNIAENSGGVHCLKYGLTLHNVLRVRMVTADGEIARMSAVLSASGATAIAVSRDEAERLRFWSGRKNAFPAAGRISPDYYCMDGTIPRRKLAEVLIGIEALSLQYELRCANVFHAGDGNLHPLILFDANQPGEFERAERFGEAILALCVAAGGTITGEHGVGIEKLDSMCEQFTVEEIAAFIAVKRAFDPARLLNPDKAIPTLDRCAQYGKRKVGAGLFKFAQSRFAHYAGETANG